MRIEEIFLLLQQQIEGELLLVAERLSFKGIRTHTAPGREAAIHPSSRRGTPDEQIRSVIADHHAVNQPPELGLFAGYLLRGKRVAGCLTGSTSSGGEAQEQNRKPAA